MKKLIEEVTPARDKLLYELLIYYTTRTVHTMYTLALKSKSSILTKKKDQRSIHRAFIVKLFSKGNEIKVSHG